MQNMQIKAEKQDSGYSVATPGYQTSPSLPLQNGGPPSHPSQLTSAYGQMPPNLHPIYGQIPGQPGPPAYPQGTQPPYYPPPAAVVGQSSKEAEVNKEQDDEKAKISENQIDFSSVKGIFGWTTVDGVNVPYIFRKEKQFVSVRIVEQKLLSKYPNSYPDELGKHQPLTSYFITAYEAKLLNEINMVHCGGEFGQKQFNSKDLIVLLEDFVDFYNLVKKTFPENKQTDNPQPHLQSMQVNIKQIVEESADPCGWIQVNNTVTPYVKRDTMGKFVPLSVMKYAAALNIPEKGVLPSEAECDLLNKACKLAGFNFTFSMTTRIICLVDILKHCNVHLIELPMENPLQHAQYLDLPSSTSSQTPTSPTDTNSLPPLIMPQTAARPDIAETVHIPTDKPTNPELPHSSRFPQPGPYMPQYPYMDPRYTMFSYNKHPMYPMQYGPPNVTVNQPHPAFSPSRSPYQNGYFPQGQVSRNPTPEQLRIRQQLQSPSSQQQPINNRVTPPQGARRPHLSPSNQGNQPSSQAMFMNRSPRMATRMSGPNPNPQGMVGHNRPPVNMNGQTMQQRAAYAPRNSNAQNRMQQASQNFPFMPNYPMPPHMQSNQTEQAVRGKTTNMPPLRNMSVPQQGPVRQPNPAQRMPSHAQQNGHPSQSPVQGGNLSNPQNPKANGSQVHDGNTPPNHNTENKPQHNQVNAKSVTTKSVPPLVESIKGVWLSGKSISCMHLDRPGRQGKFCLVEAVCKLYFNGCSVNEFLYALENVLHVPLVTCTDEEEKSFIHYYSLPVQVLKCNKMINYDDLHKFFPQLSYVFREKSGSNGDPKSSNGSTVSTSVSNGVPKNPSEGSDVSRKRPLNGAGGPMPKQPCRRLEATVQRLMNQQGTGNEITEDQAAEPVVTNPQ